MFFSHHDWHDLSLVKRRVTKRKEILHCALFADVSFYSAGSPSERLFVSPFEGNGRSADKSQPLHRGYLGCLAVELFHSQTSALAAVPT